MAETQRFQAKIVSDIRCKRSVEDLGGRRVQGYVITLEISKEEEGFDENDVIELFDGDPVDVRLCNQHRTLTSEFLTEIHKYGSNTRKDGEDKIRFLKVEIIAFRRDIRQPDNLFDLQLEEFIYVEVEPHTMHLGEATPADKAVKPRGRKKKQDEKQTELART